MDRMTKPNKETDRTWLVLLLMLAALATQIIPALIWRTP